MQKHIQELKEAGVMDPDGFFFLTSRSSSVGCVMITRRGDLDFKIEYLATVPGS